MRPRAITEPIGERVAALEADAWTYATKLAKHEERVEERLETQDTRLAGHDAILNQVKGGIRLLVVLWTIAVAILGAREFLPRAAGATPQVTKVP